jgi:hypothetical protein
MYCQTADGEGRIRGAQLVDVKDHGEQDWWGQRSVHDEAEQVVADRYTRGRSACMCQYGMCACST